MSEFVTLSRQALEKDTKWRGVLRHLVAIIYPESVRTSASSAADPNAISPP
jgi:hypothetical protein